MEANLAQTVSAEGKSVVAEMGRKYLEIIRNW